MNKKTRNIIRILLVVGTIASMFFVPWNLLRAWLRPLPDTVQEEIDAAISLGFDGMIVYVDVAGQAPRSYASGWHDRDKHIPADAGALFKIASIGKLYDAVAVSKLVYEGSLYLEKTLSEYLPELDGKLANADEITLRMLVQHRSGIPNYTNFPGFWTSPPANTQETLELILDIPASFKPGESYEYSNTNYLLISEIIHRVLGYDKFEYIREKILIPLDLQNTFQSIHEIDMDRLMSGYYVGIEEDIKAAEYGSMIATAEDVGIFLRALNDGSMFEDGEEEIYFSLYEYGHTGLIPGYQSIARYHKDVDAVVVQFVNTTDFDGNTWSLSEIIYRRIIKILERKQ